MQHFTVPLSHLIPGKHNHRQVKPAREAHDKLVALIKAHGLLHPLVVRPVEGKPTPAIPTPISAQSTLYWLQT